MATKRTPRVDHDATRNRGALVDISISRGKLRRLIVVGVVLVFAVLATILTIFSINVANFSKQVEDLRAYKDRQDKIIERIIEKCGNLSASATSFGDGYDKSACLGAVEEGKEYGVTGSYCAHSITTKKSQKPDDAPPTKDDACEEVAARIATVEGNVAIRERAEAAEKEIFNACNSRLKAASAVCNAAKAKYNYEWTYVGCNVYGYVVPSSQIYDGAWHYTYFGGVDPHANETCWW